MGVYELTSDAKDPGALQWTGERVAMQRYSRCVLSMSGAATRSTFKNCEFRNIRGVKCSVGHPVFEDSAFSDVISDETLTLFEALFIRCTFSGRVQNLNFGSIRATSPFFSQARFDDDVDRINGAAFCLDITGVTELVECSFIGDVIVRKLRFRDDQGVLLCGQHLDAILGPLLRSTTDLGLAEFLAPAVGFGATNAIHFCPVSLANRDHLLKYTAMVRDLGVDVIRGPLC